MFVYGNYLAIFGTRFRTRTNPYLHTYVLVYNIYNRFNPTRVTELAFEGRYYDARMNLNGYVYIVARQQPNATRPNPVPMFNINDNQGWVPMQSEAIFFFPGDYRVPQFINLFCFNMEDATNNMKMNLVSLVTDNAHQIYMTTSSLYLTVTRSDSQTYEDFTIIHKVYLEDFYLIPFTDSTARGSVENQFSMDEETNSQSFRIITSTFRARTASNGVYVNTFSFDLTRISELFTGFAE